MVEELLPLFYVFHKSNYTVESALPNFEIQKKKLKDKALINNFFYKKDFKNILETHSKYEDFYNNHRTHLRELYKMLINPETKTTLLIEKIKEVKQSEENAVWCWYIEAKSIESLFS